MQLAGYDAWKTTPPPEHDRRNAYAATFEGALDQRENAPRIAHFERKSQRPQVLAAAEPQQERKARIEQLAERARDLAHDLTCEAEDSIERMLLDDGIDDRAGEDD